MYYQYQINDSNGENVNDDENDKGCFGHFFLEVIDILIYLFIF